MAAVDQDLYYNVVLVQTVPRQGGSERYAEVVNSAPLTLAEAQAKRERLLGLVSGGCLGYRMVVGCHLEQVEVFKPVQQERFEYLLDLAENGMSGLLIDCLAARLAKRGKGLVRQMARRSDDGRSAAAEALRLAV